MACLAHRDMLTLAQGISLYHNSKGEPLSKSAFRLESVLFSKYKVRNGGQGRFTATMTRRPPLLTSHLSAQMLSKSIFNTCHYA